MKTATPCFLMLALAIFANTNIKAQKTYKQIPLSKHSPANSQLLHHILQQQPASFQTILQNKEALQLQIIFTQIDRDQKNTPHFTHHFYHVSDTYFYPASTVKFPAAVLALEKLNQLKIPGLQASTTMLTDSLYSKQTPVYNDPTSQFGNPSIAHYIKKILLVSDNDAFNRLYEFIGQQPLNQRLHQLGFANAQILHRLSVALSPDENRHTNPIRFADTSGNIIYNQPIKLSNMQHQQRNNKLGKGYMAADLLINEPMDFSQKNKLPLPYLHQMMQWVMFPAQQKRGKQLQLTPTDYQFLQTYLSMLPTESTYPNYDTTQYYPAYCKFLMMGGQPGKWPNANIRIFNKVGNAYGFLIDVAYIVDFQTKTEFMVSCSMLCNADGIFNDDQYDYQTIGLPFMKNLGQALYQHEKNRTKKYLPNLSNFVFNYNQ